MKQLMHVRRRYTTSEPQQSHIRHNPTLSAAHTATNHQEGLYRQTDREVWWAQEQSQTEAEGHTPPPTHINHPSAPHCPLALPALPFWTLLPTSLFPCPPLSYTTSRPTQNVVFAHANISAALHHLPHHTSCTCNHHQSPLPSPLLHQEPHPESCAWPCRNQCSAAPHTSRSPASCQGPVAPPGAAAPSVCPCDAGWPRARGRPLLWRHHGLHGWRRHAPVCGGRSGMGQGQGRCGGRGVELGVRIVYAQSVDSGDCILLEICHVGSAG